LTHEFSNSNDTDQKLYFNFIAANGDILDIGHTAELHRNNILKDINYKTHDDGSITILITRLFDYDFMFPFVEIHFDGKDATRVIWDYDFDNVNFWTDSGTFYGDDSYLIGGQDSLFLVDANHQYLETIANIGMLEVIHTTLGPRIYSDTTLYELDDESALVPVMDFQDLSLFTEFDGHFFAQTQDQVIQMTHDYEIVHAWTISTDQSLYNITGGQDDYYFYLYNNESKQYEIWNTFEGQELTLVVADTNADEALQVITHTLDTEYRLTSQRSGEHEHTLVTATNRGTEAMDFDYFETLHLVDSQLNLDSILYGGFTLWGDTIHYDYHYYNGFIAIENQSQDTLRSTNIYTEPIQLHYPWGYDNTITFDVDTLIAPLDTLIYQYQIRTQSPIPQETLQLKIYGANDLTLGYPVVSNTPIIASTNSIESLPFLVFPNPVSDKIRIEVENPQDLSHVIMTTIDGRVVKYFDSYQESYPVQDLMVGLYSLRIITQSGQQGVQMIYIE